MLIMIDNSSHLLTRNNLNYVLRTWPLWTLHIKSCNPAGISTLFPPLKQRQVPWLNQRWITFRFCKTDQRWYCDVVSPRKQQRWFTVEIATLFHSYLSGYWINVVIVTLFHRRTFQRSIVVKCPSKHSLLKLLILQFSLNVNTEM